MDVILEEFQTITVSKVVQWACSGAMIFGGVIPYIPQYNEIKKTENADGFSLHVCLALLVANILRILYWFGHGFELPLLVQSIVMIIAMMVMIKLCVEVKHKNQIIKGPPTGASVSSVLPNHTFRDFDSKFFWKWTDFQSYVECVLLFGALSSAALYLLHHSVVFVETVGVLAVFTESLLGVPQLLRNLAQRSTHGMSVKMVLMWTSGDAFKTGYFLLREAPVQFGAAALLQVAVDIAILTQVWLYGSAAPSATSAAPRHKAMELVE